MEEVHVVIYTLHCIKNVTIDYKDISYFMEQRLVATVSQYK